MITINPPLRLLPTFCLVLVCASLSTSTANAWSKLGNGDGAPKVSGHSTAGSYLFGGLTGPAGSPCTDETWTFNTVNNGWERLRPASSSSSPRKRMYAASAMTDEGRFVVLGGWDPGEPGSGGEFLDDVWEYDPVENEWTESDVRLPWPVSRHAACAVSDGEGRSTIVVHTHKGVLVYGPDQKTIKEQTTYGDGPDGYSMCAAAPLGGGSRMLVFGGSTRTQEMSRDVHVLDTNDWTWTRLDVDADGDEGPPAMASACAARLTDNEVVVFGGACVGPTGYDGGFGLVPQNETWLLKVDDDGGKAKARWSKIELENKPEGRVASSLFPVGPSSFLLQGGYDTLTKTTFGDPWLLEL